MDVVLVIVAAFFIPVINALCGAALGTLLLGAEMFFLMLGVQNISNGARQGRNGTAKAVTFYILRMAFIALGLYVALVFKYTSIVCTAIPLFYPKLIYPVKAILIKKEG